MGRWSGRWRCTEAGRACRGIGSRRGKTADPLTRRGRTGSLLQVQPDEAGHFLAHELGAAAVDLVVLLRRLRPGLRIAAGLVQRRGRGLEGLFPLRVLRLEFRVAEAVGRGNQGDAVPDEQVELAVAVDVRGPDP